MPVLTRRSFAAALGGCSLTACMSAQFGGSSNNRLKARPGKTAAGREPGLYPLALRQQRDSLLYIPKLPDPDKPAPLFVYLHGAGGSEQQGINRIRLFADDLGFLLLSPGSEGSTWDGIQEGYGPDVTMVDRALTKTFEARLVDPNRIAIGGFSDGASYGLGLGLSNGDLFTSLLAFSPGFIPPGSKLTGKPRIFISHGTNDAILPIDSCSRRLVPELKRGGYTVNYQEFNGPHTVPREIADQAFRWFLG
jgi:phospholipase/carboxylesterase